MKYSIELDGYELVNLLWLILATQPSHCTGDWHCQIRWKLEQAAGVESPPRYGTTTKEELAATATAVGCAPNHNDLP